MQRNIEKIRYYSCGYCKNNLKIVFKKYYNKVRDFPAGVFLIKHKQKGYILFDTGYSEDIYKLGIKGKLYNFFNPTFINKENQINNQLIKDNIKCEDIKYIILSHLHPDHIGGLKYFKKSKIIISREAFNTYKNNKLRYLIFDKMIPSWFEENLIILEDNDFKDDKYFKSCDFFKDSSMLISKINGHAFGQLACLIENKIFLGADSSWGNEFVGKSNDLKFFPRLVQSDIKEYINNDKILLNMRNDGFKLCFSHDVYNLKEIDI